MSESPRWSGANLRLLHDPPLAALCARLDRLKAAGANSVALVPTHYCEVENTPAHHVVIPAWTDSAIWADTGQVWGNTTPLAKLHAVAMAAKRRGLRVALKPHIDPVYWHAGDQRYYAAGWRFYIDPSNAVDAWTTAYRAFLRPYLQMARDLALPLVVLGTELGTISRSPAFGAAWWADLAAWARTVGYTGLLTYASNWAEEDLPDLWPHLDAIGVDWYFPTPAGADARVIAAAWAEPAARLLALAQSTDRPLLLTEIGVGAWVGSELNPGADPPPTVAHDAGLPLAWLTAYHTTFDGQPWSAGALWWESSGLGSSHEIDATPTLGALWHGWPVG
jgi:hypothetical protein